MFLDQDCFRLLTDLTAKQREVVELCARGFSVKEMAQRLGVTPSAVDQRLSGALRKLGVKDRSQITLALPQSIFEPRSNYENALVSDAPVFHDFGEDTGNCETASLDSGSQFTATIEAPVYTRGNESGYITGFLLGFLSGVVLTSAIYFSSLWAVFHMAITSA